MEIAILSNRSLKAHCFTYPIKVFHNDLNDLGLHVQFHYRITRRLYDCDVLCVVRSGFHQKYSNDILRELKAAVPRLVYFDSGDSSGIVEAGALKIADVYAKNQLLKNRALYAEPLYGRTSFADYYHQKYNIIDQDEITWPVADAKFLHKLTLSWNLGLSDWNIHREFGKLGRSFSIYWPFLTYRVKTTRPSLANRDLDIAYHASSNYLGTVSYQRDETHRQLESFRSQHPYKVVFEGKLPYLQYRQEMRRSVVIPSPFGWGEVCFRDFEGYLDGGILLKPDMDHMETWPNYYEPNVTYVPHAWDFSDFQPKLAEILASKQRYLPIAEAGQQRFLESLSDEGGALFAQRFKQIVAA